MAHQILPLSPAGILLCCPSPDTSLGMIISFSLLREKSSLAVWSSHVEENKGLAAAPAERLVTGSQQLTS